MFATGASGWIGSAVVPDLIDRGHEVIGPARSDASADTIAAAGADVLRGSLAELDSLHEGATKSDGVIHLAFIHDFSQYDDANSVDREAIAAMGATLEGFPRSAATTLTLALADRGVRSSVVRLPPTVHGRGDRGFIPMLIQVARDTGASGYVGDGSNVWPAVHRSDAATVFGLALEHAAAASVWHAVAEPGVPTRVIADAIGRQLGVPVTSIDPGDATEHFGWIGAIWALDAPTSSALTRDRLGWTPSGPGLLEDLEQGHYFRSGAVG